MTCINEAAFKSPPSWFLYRLVRFVSLAASLGESPRSRVTKGNLDLRLLKASGELMPWKRKRFNIVFREGWLSHLAGALPASLSINRRDHRRNSHVC
ncbi:hypothetical protein PUN28_008898 [Cardiocondyla obscurior]|uniref:Uncharacterized protein n=1 Tax=Cardiocondyla obscurior TaxID=286306 RepID=A0AAW2FPF7_9HYME